MAIENQNQFEKVLKYQSDQTRLRFQKMNQLDVKQSQAKEVK